MEKKHIVCPSCAAVNRVSEERLDEHPKCGKCGEQLFKAEPLDATEAMFHQHINKNDIPVLVDFWASWCGPCKMMAPAYHQAASELEPKVRLLKVNTEQAQQLSGQLGIRSIPTLALFKNGKEIDRVAGALDASSLLSWVQQRI
jgi:thioredoxin 2